MLSESGIPELSTEDDAVRGFMYVVKHREVVPPNWRRCRPPCPAVRAGYRYRPRHRRHRRSPMAAVAGPGRDQRLLELMTLRWWPTFAAADAEQAVAYASTISRKRHRGAQIMSRDIVHKSDVGGVVLNLTSAMPCARQRPRFWRRRKALRPEARISGVTCRRCGAGESA